MRAAKEECRGESCPALSVRSFVKVSEENLKGYIPKKEKAGSIFFLINKHEAIMEKNKICLNFSAFCINRKVGNVSILYPLAKMRKVLLLPEPTVDKINSVVCVLEGVHPTG